MIAKRGRSSRITKADAFINKLYTNNIEVSELTASIYDHQGINLAIGDSDDEVVTPGVVAF